MEDDERKSLIIFGRDVSKIPCYRESLLWGISGGFGGGFTYFLFTSNVRMASHVSVGSFMATTLVYWFRCRYIYFNQKHELQRVQSAIEKQMLLDGTLPENSLEDKIKLDLKTA